MLAGGGALVYRIGGGGFEEEGSVAGGSEGEGGERQVDSGHAHPAGARKHHAKRPDCMQLVKVDVNAAVALPARARHKRGVPADVVDSVRLAGLHRRRGGRVNALE